MQCKVTMQRPDGTHARHVGHYPNPGMAMDAVQALHPDCAVNAAVATSPASPASPTSQGTPRSCDALGVCQSVTKACPPHTMCARKNPAHFFAPGTIGVAAGALPPADAGGCVDLGWRELLGGIGLVILAGVVYGVLA